jgi:hypothetical protein
MNNKDKKKLDKALNVIIEIYDKYTWTGREQTFFFPEYPKYVVSLKKQMDYVIKK